MSRELRAVGPLEVPPSQSAITKLVQDSASSVCRAAREDTSATRSAGNMAGTAELRAVLALQKKQLEQLAEQQQLFETLLANQTTGTETPPTTTTTAPVTPAVNEAAPPEDKFVRVTFKVSRVTDIDDKNSTFTAAIKYTATWQPDHDDLQALRRHFAQAEQASEPGVPTWSEWLSDEQHPDQFASGLMPNKWNFDVNPGGEKLPMGVWEPRLWSVSDKSVLVRG